MGDKTRIYIAVESGDERLIVDGSMRLWLELLDSLGRRAVIDAEPEDDQE